MANYVKKGNDKYAMLQIKADTHKKLKQHCDKHGYAMSKIVTIMVDNLVKESIQKELVK